MLSCIAKGAWMDMLCILADADDCGTLTNSATAWARYIGLTKDELLGVVQELEAGGVGNIKIEGEQITITSNRLKRDYKEYRAQSNQASEAGKKSAESRRKKRKVNESKTDVERPLNDRSNEKPTTVERPLNEPTNEKATIPEARSQKPERSNERNARAPDEAAIPTLEEIQTQGQFIGASMELCEKFFDHYQGKQLWFNQWNRLIDWKHELRTWKKNGLKTNGKSNGNQPAVDRNQGTANARIKNRYAEVGRVVPNKSVQR